MLPWVAGLTVVCILLIFVCIYLFLQNKNLNNKLNEISSLFSKKDHRIEELEHLTSGQKELIHKIVGVLSHDLRSPFATFESLMVLFSHQEYNEEQFKQYILRLQSISSSSLLTLENTVLWLKLNAEGCTVNPTIFNLKEAVKDICDIFERSISNKNIVISIDIPSAFTAKFDLAHFSIIFKNMLSNAIKFNNIEGKIAIRALKGEGGLILEVEDTGLGIETKKLSSLFNYVKNNSTYGTNHEKGVGLGLILSKVLAENNGAGIFIKSEFKKGSIVTLNLQVP